MSRPTVDGFISRQQVPLATGEDTSGDGALGHITGSCELKTISIKAKYVSSFQ